MLTDKFVNRHIGPRDSDLAVMLDKIGVSSLDELIDQTIPANIRLKKPLNLAEGLTERQYYRKILDLASKNKVFNTYIGMGYYDTVTPAVIFAQCSGESRLVHFLYSLPGRNFAGPPRGAS